MQIENATALVVRASDWSETSSIATLFTREHGKLRVLAKGARRLRSSFEVSLDLLTVCRIVVIRKQSGLDLLTEARVEERFGGLRSRLPALYAGYYIAELLGDGTQDHDPHPTLFDAALENLRSLNNPGCDIVRQTMRFELVWLHELGYRPRLDRCAVCNAEDLKPSAGRISFSPVAGGVVCEACEAGQRDRRPLSVAAWAVLRSLYRDAAGEFGPLVGAELRQLLGQYVSTVLGRRPKLLAYLE